MNGRGALCAWRRIVCVIVRIKFVSGCVAIFQGSKNTVEDIDCKMLALFFLLFE